DQLFDLQPGGVDAQVVVGPVAPFDGGEHPVVAGAASVHLPDLLFQGFGAGGAGLLVALAAGQLVLHAGVDEQLEGVLLRQDDVGGPPHDDAVGGCRDLAEDLPLLHQDVHLLLVQAGAGDGPAKVEGDIGKDPVFHRPGDVALVQVHVLGDAGLDLAVVVGAVQGVGQPCAGLPPAAAKLAADGDDAVHNDASFGVKRRRDGAGRPGSGAG